MDITNTGLTHMMANVSILEWLWFFTAFVGWIVKLTLVGYTHAQYVFAGGRTGPSYMTKTIYYHTWHMLTIFTIVLMEATWAVLKAPPPPPLIGTQSFGITIMGLLLSLILLGHALLVMRWWHRIGSVGSNGDESHELKLPAVITTKVTGPHSVQTEITSPGVNGYLKTETSAHE